MTNTMDRRLNLERINLERENQVLAELKKKKQKMAKEEEDRKTLKEGQSTWEKILTQDQERNSQRQHHRSALSEKHLLQIQEKLRLKAEEKERSKKDLEMLKNLDELHAQELRRQEEEKPLLQKTERKNRLEDISRMNSYREKQAEKILREEERTKLAHLEMEDKLLQRKAEAAGRVMRHSLIAQPVIDKLASLRKEQAAAAAEKDEQNFVSCLAKRQARKEKLQKDAQKKAEVLQSIAAHRQEMVQEKQQREEAERQSNAAWLQTQKDADRLFLEENKLKAERARKEQLRVRNFKDSLEADKIKVRQTLTNKDYGTAIHTLGGGVSFSCGEGSSYVTSDITATPLIHYGRAVKKQQQQQDCERLGEPEKYNAVDINSTNKPLEKVTVLTQDHKDMVQLRPTPPPAELRKDTHRSRRAKKLIIKPEAVSVNHSSEKSHMDRDNQVMAELKIVKQKMAEAEERRKTVKVALSTCDRVLRQDNERNLQMQHNRKALVGQHLLQMREKELQKAQEQRENKRDLEMRRNMDKLYAQEVKWQEEQKPLLKKKERVNRLEDIARSNSYRREQAKILRAEEERTKLASLEIKGKVLQRQADATVKVTRQMLTSKIAFDNLASLKKTQAAAAAKKDESLYRGLAWKRAGQERQLTEKAKQKAEELQSISAHRQKMIEERQQKEEARRQSNAAYHQTKKDADRLFLEENELKAEMARNEKIQLRNFNDSLGAEKRQIQLTPIMKDSGHTLGGGINFSCGEGSSYVTADTATQLIHFGRPNKKQIQQIGLPTYIKLPHIPNKYRKSKNI